MEMQLADVVGSLRSAHRFGRKCALLIGAGCSFQAGIPTAAGFVEIIKEQFPYAFERADPQDYPQCMAHLSPGDRMDLIRERISRAQINWAHIAIAQLIKKGIVDRVLTVNFDPLVLRACALVGVFPSVYDLAASPDINLDNVSDPSVFYLHGQHTGVRILNTREECEQISRHVAPIFSDAGRNRVWIVVGYSGENDPVFEHLAQVNQFNRRLFWVGRSKNSVPAHVQSRLIGAGKQAFYVGGYDADSFFVSLAQQLSCFPPDFVGRPFSYLGEILNRLTPYTLPGYTEPVDSKARELIQEVVKYYEDDADIPVESRKPDSSPNVLQAQTLLMSGDYARVIALYSESRDGLSPEIVDVLSWAYTLKGHKLALDARVKLGAEADKLFSQAAEAYRAALEVKPDRHEALYNWGNLMDDQAQRKQGPEADELFEQAFAMYERALAIDPGKAIALDNWGLALMDQADQKTGEERRSKLLQARDKCEQAERISPGRATYNLACISALLGEEEACRQWLEKCRQFGELPGIRHIIEDRDLESVRGAPWFQSFLTQ